MFSAGRSPEHDPESRSIPMMVWTDDELLVTVLAEGFGAEQQAMYEWWLGDSGPVRP